MTNGNENLTEKRVLLRPNSTKDNNADKLNQMEGKQCKAGYHSEGEAATMAKTDTKERAKTDSERKKSDKTTKAEEEKKKRRAQVMAAAKKKREE